MRRKLAAIFPCVFIMISHDAIAGNGINDFGYGAVSGSVGGADLAIDSGVFALNTNPASLANISGKRTELNVEPFYYFNTHNDQYGGKEELDPQSSAVFAIGHAQGIEGTSFSFGLGLFAQGGVGFTYKDINTAFGNQDTISSTFGSFKFQTALAWQSDDGRLRLGAALGLIYSEAEQELFPETSFDDGAGNFFYGIKVSGVSGFSTAARVGLQYDISEDWSIGASYALDSPIKLEDGHATLNQSASGFGKVTYNDASIEGLNIAADYGVGLAYRGIPDWIISADYMIVRWSEAIKSSTLILSRLSSPGATPDTLKLKSTLNWRDQNVVAIGAQYRLSEFSKLYFGYNYGRNPLPEAHTDPLFAVLATRHFTVGFSRKFSEHFEFIGGFVYQPLVEVEYTNSELPYGENTVSKWRVAVINATVVYHW